MVLISMAMLQLFRLRRMSSCLFSHRFAAGNISRHGPCRFFSSHSDNGTSEEEDEEDEDEAWKHSETSSHEAYTHNATPSPKESLLAFIHKASGGRTSTALEAQDKQARIIPNTLQHSQTFPASHGHPERPVKIRYVRYLDSFLLGIDGPVELVKKIQKRITEFLQNELNLEADSSFTHVAAGNVNFLGTVIQAVPVSPVRKDLKALEKRRRVKHRIQKIAAQRRFSIQTRIENLGKNILARELKRRKRETGSLREAGHRLAETLKSAGVAADSDPTREAAQSIQEKSREILRRVGWSNMPLDVQEAFLRLDESLGSWMSSFEASTDGGDRESRRGMGRHVRSKDDVEIWEDRKPPVRFVIKILAPINTLVLRLRARGIVAEKKRLPTHIGRLTGLPDEDIVNWFSTVAAGLLSYYRCCDNFNEVKEIVDYHIRWSAIFTLAHKHKSSARKIIQNISKDMHIVDGEGRVLAKYPNSIEIRMIKRGFFERNRIFKNDLEKVMDSVLFRYCKGDERYARN